MSSKQWPFMETCCSRGLPFEAMCQNQNECKQWSIQKSFVCFFKKKSPPYGEHLFGSGLDCAFIE